MDASSFEQKSSVSRPTVYFILRGQKTEIANKKGERLFSLLFCDYAKKREGRKETGASRFVQKSRFSDEGVFHTPRRKSAIKKSRDFPALFGYAERRAP